MPLSGEPTYIDRMSEAPTGDVWVIGRHDSQRLAWVDRGTGFERVEGIPDGVMDVCALGTNDVWFCGTNGHLFHYDGTNWSRRVFEKFYYDFSDIVARDGSDIWVATRGVVHFDGTSFHNDNPPELFGGSVHALHSTSDSILVPMYIVGEKQSHVARHKNGTWSREHLGPGAVEWIHGSGDDNVWASAMRDDAWHYDGKTWTHVPTVKTRVYALHVSAPDRAYLVGDDGALVRWDGGRWTPTSIGSDRLVSVHRGRDGRLLAGGTRLYRRREPDA